MATPAEVNRLRAIVGERIPEGGGESDTLFPTLELSELIDEASGDLDRAAYEAWRIKAAHFAGLVNVTDGASTRELSDLHKQALDMVKVYSRSLGGLTEGRTRIGRIVRP